jgi:hypothetical protein
MPPVQVMGHLLPSRLPDKRSRPAWSKHSTNPEGGSMVLARTPQAGLPRQKHWHCCEVPGIQFVQAAERYSLGWCQGAARRPDADTRRRLPKGFLTFWS